MTVAIGVALDVAVTSTGKSVASLMTCAFVADAPPTPESLKDVSS